MKKIFITLLILLYSNLYAVTQAQCEAITSNGGALWDSVALTCDCMEPSLSASNNCECSQAGWVFDTNTMSCINPALESACNAITANGGALWDGNAQICTCMNTYFNVDNGCDCPSGQHFNSNTSTCEAYQTCNDIDLVAYSQTNCTNAQYAHLISITCTDGNNAPPNIDLQCAICNANQTFNTTTNVCEDPPCPIGQELVSGVCQDIVCPTGQELVSGVCQDIVCPTGQSLNVSGICVDVAESYLNPNQYIGQCTHYCFTGVSGDSHAVYARQAPVDLQGGTISCSYNHTEYLTRTLSNAGCNAWNISHPDNIKTSIDKEYATFYYPIDSSTKSFCNESYTYTLSFYPSCPSPNDVIIQTQSVVNGLNWQQIDGYAVDYCGDGNLQLCGNNDINGTSSSDNSDIYDRLDSIVNNTNTTNTKLDGVKTSVDGVKTAVDGVKTAVDGVKTAVNGVKSSVDGVKTSVDGVKTAVLDGNSKLDGIKGAIDNLNTSSSTINNNSATTNNNLTNIDSSIATTNNNLTNIDNSIAGTNANLDSLKTAVDNANTNISNEIVKNREDSQDNWDKFFDDFLFYDGLASGYSNVLTTSSSFANNVISQYDVVRNQITSVENTINNGFTNTLSSDLIDTCPYQRTIIGSNGVSNIPITIDICAIIKPIQSVTYFIFYVLFFGGFLASVSHIVFNLRSD